MKRIIAVSMIIFLAAALCACEFLTEILNELDDSDGAPAFGDGTAPRETEAGKPEQQDPDAETPEGGGNGYSHEMGIFTGEKYYCRDDISRSIMFNKDGIFIYEDEWGSATGDYIFADGEIIYVRFHQIEDDDFGDGGYDGYFTIIDMKNLEEMHGEIYTVEPFAANPVNSGGTGATPVQWQEGSIYINSEKGVAVEISQVSAKEFWFDIVQMMDVRDMDKIYGLNSLSEVSETENSGYYVFSYGWAQIEADNAYFAMFDSYGFSLYEDNDAIDIFAGESTDWSHLRGQYMRIR